MVTSSPLPEPAPQPRKPRVPRRIEVVSVERPAPSWVSVRFHGDELDGFRIDAPTGHVKLFFPAEGETAVPDPSVVDGRVVFSDAAVQPAVRTYTPRRFDSEERTLEVQFFLHGDGPASRWAERAAVGHRLVLTGPGGRFVLEPGVRRWWIAGDESALPAIATLLEALPPGAAAEVHAEVAGEGDKLDLVSAAQTRVVWHERRSPDGFGAEIIDALGAAGAAAGERFWVACEAGATRAIRGLLLNELGLPRTSVVTRGYWRRGEANHPDHDYGED